MTKAIWILGLVGGAGWVGVAVAADPSGATAGPQIGPAIVRLGVALVGVIALVYLVAFVVRRSNSATPIRANRLMSVVEVLPLGPKSRLVAVRVGERVFIIGAGEGAVSAVTELGADEAAAALEAGATPVIPFRDRLLRLARK